MMDILPIDTTTITGLIAFALGTYTNEQVREPIAKLVMTVRDRIGWQFEPQRIRDMAEAEADARITAAKADSEIELIKVQRKIDAQDLRTRTTLRITSNQQREQVNIEAVVQKATRHLPEKVSEKPVDQDWTTQFFDNCKNVGNQEMQVLWGKLLAGEVASPGSFSLKTLGVIRVMNMRDAELFTKLCSTVWNTDVGLKPIFPLVMSSDGLNSDLIPQDFFRLDALGLVQYFPHTTFSLFFDDGEYPPTLNLTYFGDTHRFDAIGVKNYCSEFPFLTGHVLLTEAGRELVPIANGERNEQYRTAAIKQVRKCGWECPQV